MSYLTWSTIRALSSEGMEQKDTMDASFQAYQTLAANPASILDYLEFEEPEYFGSLTLPEDESGMSIVGKSGKAVKRDYLYNR